MLYKITQQTFPKPDKSPRSRTIHIDLPDQVHALATELDIQIVIEVGPELISLEGTFGNKGCRLDRVAKLELPGFIMGTHKTPGPQRACIDLIEEAWNSQQK